MTEIWIDVELRRVAGHVRGRAREYTQNWIY